MERLLDELQHQVTEFASQETIFKHLRAEIKAMRATLKLPPSRQH
jgi:hypothetical protein